MGYYQLTYIYHDCFMLETHEAVIIFDYWKDPLSIGQDKDYPPLLNEIDISKKIYILVSHHHKDHFSRRVFLWCTRLPDIHFIISRDVYKSVRYMLKEGGTYEGFKPPLEKITVLEPGQTYTDEIILVEAFESTDIGNSYALQTGGYKFFHAGDLNAWIWLDESTKKEVEEAKNNFVDIVERIKKKYPEFDLVMFPVDSRQGREYWWGAGYFVKAIMCRLFVPMHFELVLSEIEKEQRRIDAALFDCYARPDYGAYLQLASTRARYLSNWL